MFSYTYSVEDKRTVLEQSAEEMAMTGVLFVLGLLAGISACVAICSRALKAEQRAFALAGACLTGERQALAWISGGRPALAGKRAPSEPQLAERKS